MAVYRIICICGLIMTIAVGYVHQRVEIIKMGYSLQENKKYLSRLVDQNSKLMYNLSKLESPRGLLTTLGAEKIEFANQRSELKESYLVVKAQPEKKGTMESFFGRFFDIFTVKAEAKPHS